MRVPASTRIEEFYNTNHSRTDGKFSSGTSTKISVSGLRGKTMTAKLRTSSQSHHTVSSEAWAKLLTAKHQTVANKGTGKTVTVGGKKTSRPTAEQAKANAQKMADDMKREAVSQGQATRAVIAARLKEYKKIGVGAIIPKFGDPNSSMNRW